MAFPRSYKQIHDILTAKITHDQIKNLQVEFRCFCWKLVNYQEEFVCLYSSNKNTLKYT